MQELVKPRQSALDIAREKGGPLARDAWQQGREGLRQAGDAARGVAEGFQEAGRRAAGYWGGDDGYELAGAGAGRSRPRVVIDDEPIRDTSDIYMAGKKGRGGKNARTNLNGEIEEYENSHSNTSGHEPAPEAPGSSREKPPVIGITRPYNEARKNRIPDFDDHHLIPDWGQGNPKYKTGLTIPVLNENAGGKISGGRNFHTGKGGFQTAFSDHVTKDLGYTKKQWNSLPEETKLIHARRYYGSLGVYFPE